MAKNVKDDIARLFEYELVAMRKDIPLREDRPGEEQVTKLVSKPDGLFIYAATACRFLGAATSEKLANIRLETIFDGDLPSNSPQRNFDNIYARILMFSVAGKIEKEKQEI